MRLPTLTYLSVMSILYHSFLNVKICCPYLNMPCSIANSAELTLFLWVSKYNTSSFWLLKLSFLIFMVSYNKRIKKPYLYLFFFSALLSILSWYFVEFVTLSWCILCSCLFLSSAAFFASLIFTRSFGWCSRFVICTFLKSLFRYVLSLVFTFISTIISFLSS